MIYAPKLPLIMTMAEPDCPIGGNSPLHSPPHTLPYFPFRFPPLPFPLLEVGSFNTAKGYGGAL